MKKIKLFFLMLCLSVSFVKAQTCTTPIAITTDGAWRGIDSFSTTDRWHTFNADHDNYKLKLFVQNYTSTNFEAILYTNNCASPIALSQTISSIGDTVTIYTEGLTIGNDYLLQLRNDTSGLTYRVYDIEMEKWMAYTQVTLGCGSATCATQPSTCELVCNGNFECLVGTLSGGLGINKAANWTAGNTTGTPDLFSTAALNQTLSGVPCNEWGTQYPVSGNSYVGIIVTNTDPAQFYEYIETKLASPLTAGKTYIISMWVSKAERSYKQVKNLAVYLTNGQVNQNSTSIFTIAPTATVNNTSLLNDYSNWRYIGFCYTPTVSGQQYLSIGPGSIQTPNTTNGPSSTCSYSLNGISYPATGYLYIDDVSVQEMKVQSAGTQTVCPNVAAPLAAPIPTCNNWSQFVYANWTPSANINPQGYTNPSVTISSNQNFTVDLGFTGSDNKVCSVTGQQSVNVLPNTLTISAPTNTYCDGQSSVTLTASGGTGTYTWQPGGLTGSSIAVSPVGNTTYTVSGLNSYGCVNSQTFTVYSPMVHHYTFSASTNPQMICSNFGESATLTATSNDFNTVYTWQPGNLSGAVQTVTPTSNTNYTAYGTYGGCTYTQQVTIRSNSACCTSTNPAFALTAFPTNTASSITYTAPLLFNNDVTIPPGMTVTFSNAEFIFAPGVKIIVSNGGAFQMRGAHLYGCGTSLWQGVVVQDGGKVYTSIGNPMHNLVEDAVVAIDVSNNITSTVTSILSLNKVTFNKNFIGVKVDTYQNASTAYPFTITECVFTSRSLTFTPTSWPATDETTGLRTANNATTGLAAPYLLQNATIANLKNPYSIHSASVGILISNVGTTSGATYYGITVGAGTVAANFNVFDNLMYGIYGYNSNISSINNVFQNAQRLQFCDPRCHYDGGTAIKHLIFGNMNAQLKMSATGTSSTSLSLGNRFWDCHYGVEASNVLKIDCNYATFRSTQTTSNPFGVNPGYMGIQNSTNRFDLNINNCNFNNINTGINIPLTSGAYVFSGTTYTGTYASAFNILNNFFGPQTSTSTAITNQYMKQAVNVSATTGSGWMNNMSVPLTIQTNTINRVFNGVAMNTYTLGGLIKNNTIDLLNDGVFSAPQKGITVNNSNGLTVQGNTLSATNITNTAITLVYSGANTGHGVVCNTTSNAYKAFEFNSPHMGTNAWKGNIMQTHNFGFVLTNSCSIGTQGGSGAPSDNQWNGSTWTGGNFGTYVDGTSNATNSKLWVRTGTPWFPPNGGFPFGAGGQSYTLTANTPTTGTGAYSCPGGGGNGNRLSGSATGTHQDHSDEANSLGLRLSTGTSEISDMDYIYLTAKYRYLRTNDSVRNSEQANIDFYNNLAGTTIETFAQADEAIASGNSNTSYALSSAVTATNNVEGNYKKFYDYYNKYATVNFSQTDSTDLYAFASLCPGLDGACVYQGRALYNTIYNNATSFNDNCSEATTQRVAASKKGIDKNWSVTIYPNPAQKQITIVSKEASEALSITIKDVTGKTVLSQNLVTSANLSNLGLNLMNGVYLVTIKNSNHETVTKKLVINN